MIIALVSDLIFASRISATAAHVGAEVDARQSSQLPDSDAPPAAVIVDLTITNGDPFEAIRDAKARWPEVVVIGFFPHVQTDLKRQAQAAGADQILPRSVFTEQLPDILRRFAGQTGN